MCYDSHETATTVTIGATLRMNRPWRRRGVIQLPPTAHKWVRDPASPVALSLLVLAAIRLG